MYVYMCICIYINALLQKEGLVLNPAGGVDGFTQVHICVYIYIYIDVYDNIYIYVYMYISI